MWWASQRGRGPRALRPDVFEFAAGTAMTDHWRVCCMLRIEDIGGHQEAWVYRAANAQGGKLYTGGGPGAWSTFEFPGEIHARRFVDAVTAHVGAEGAR